MDQNPNNNNNNRLYNTITNSFIICFVGNAIHRYTTPQLATFLTMAAFYNANLDDLNNIVHVFFNNLRNNEELVNLANQITFAYLFGNLNIQDGGGGGENRKNNYDVQMNEFEVALDNFCQNNYNKINFDKLKQKFKNVFCVPEINGEINGGIRKKHIEGKIKTRGNLDENIKFLK